MNVPRAMLLASLLPSFAAAGYSRAALAALADALQAPAAVRPAAAARPVSGPELVGAWEIVYASWLYGAEKRERDWLGPGKDSRARVVFDEDMSFSIEPDGSGTISAVRGTWDGGEGLIRLTWNGREQALLSGVSGDVVALGSEADRALLVLRRAAN